MDNTKAVLYRKRGRLKPSSFSALHVLAEKACDGLRELVLRLACGRLALGADEDHEPECVALGDDGRGDGRAVASSDSVTNTLRSLGTAR